MPQYYEAWPAAIANLRLALQPLSAGLKSTLAEGELQSRIAALGRTEESVGVLPIRGRSRDGMMIFDRATGEPLGYWPVRR